MMLYFKNRQEWRNWLIKNHFKEKEVWLVYYKKHTKKESIGYNDAVEEALCFGWIDSKVKRIDDERYMQKYTPRNSNSVWSLVNKKRSEKMIRLGKMTEAGMEKIRIAKENGWWDRAYTSRDTAKIPEDLKEELNKDKKALNNFSQFTNSQKTMYIHWIEEAKKEDTRKKRIIEVKKDVS